MNESPPPQQWRPLFDKIGVEFGYRPLATRINMDHTRLRRLMLGGGTSEAAIQAVADAFGVTTERIRELRGEQAVAFEPFILPEDAGRLTQSERRVIRSVVRALLDARDHHAVSSDQTPPPGTSPQARQAEEVPSSDDPEVDPRIGFDRWRDNADEVEDGDDSQDETG